MAKNSKEYELAIKIAGEIEKSFFNSTKISKKELQDIAKQASDVSNGLGNSFYKGFDSMDKGFSKIGRVASKSFRAVKNTAELAAAAVATIAAASAVAGMSFESSFAGVKKTTDATAEEYEKIRQGILDMTDDIPATANEIAEVAEAAGQLGIEKENLLDFSRVMIDLGESTNLTATEGASDLAKFANITGMAADEYSNLGSVIVALGNNFATTEADIVDMATNLAASGDLAGLSEAQIMAISTAISSVGIEAEAGGSSMSKLLKKIQVSVETGNKSLNQFASVAGMSSKEFKEAFKEDAVGALSSFIDGLNDVKRNGKSATVILDDMGLTEVRLSNTILSLANSNGLMTEAVNLANQAWDENTALSKEAAQRYETNESKLKIFRNGITGLGIQLYDEYSEPLGEAIEAGTDFVKNLSDEVVPNLVDTFKEKLPTVIRKVKEYTASFIEFADPLISLGKWLIKNPDVVVSTLVGIGSALLTYKVASGIKDVAKSFTALSTVLTNPFALAITGVALAIGGAAGIITYIKKAEKEMKKQNLAEHFGNISLSIGELQEVASHIIQTNNLGKLHEAISAMDDMETIAGSIEDVVKSLNKMNWKVGIGMELTEDEKQEYQTNITSYIAGVQDLVTEKQYAVTLAVGVLMGNDDLESSNVITQINDFYAGKQKELAELGTKLNETVTNAFQDGLLDIEEIKEISELQSQMAKIQSAIAGSQFDAQLELLNLKYSGADLDPETFQNLQTEIAEQVKAASADYDKALTLSLANAKLMLDEGSINTEQYNEQIKQYKEGYLQQIGDIELKASNFQLDTIMTQYSEELGAAMPEFEQYINEALQGSTDYINSGLGNMPLNWDTLFNDIEDYDGLDKATKSALKDLFKQMQPTIEQMNELKEKYEEYGVEIPASISKGLNDAAILGALTGDYNSIWSVLGEEVAKSEEHTKAIEMVKENGMYIPEELGKAIEDNKAAVEKPIDGLYSHSKDYMNKIFSSGFMFTLPVSLNPEYNMAGNGQLPKGSVAWSEKRWKEYRLTGHADGGIFDTPHIAWFAEAGPEAAIPLDGSERAIGLWKTVGKLLGVYTQGKNGASFESLASDSNEDSFSSILNRLSSKKNSTGSGSRGGIGNITYSPIINFYGGTPSKEDIVEAGHISQEEFDERMEQWMYGKNRVQFVN